MDQNSVRNYLEERLINFYKLNPHLFNGLQRHQGKKYTIRGENEFMLCNF